MILLAGIFVALLGCVSLAAAWFFGDKKDVQGEAPLVVLGVFLISIGSIAIGWFMRGYSI